ncbi:MAG: type II toxin-antitoxin system VapC family toxin [Acidobacteria bacterium]|nr:type II toxin-antitoxin system VapC family toxin [Acidobacteriota bacterium]
MNVYVVDASVAIKWFFQEAHTEDALRLARHSNILCAPDFLWIETASVVCQRVQKRQIVGEEGRRVLSALRLLPIQIFRSTDLLDPAISIAIETAASIYDCLYITLAVSLEARMVTADRQLYRKLAPSPLARRLLWVEDIP